MNIQTWQEKYAYEREHEVVDSQTRCKWMQEEIDALRAAIDAPEQEPYGWMIQGVPTVMRGSLAQDIQEAEAKRIGGTCRAFPVYREQQPIADLTDEEIAEIFVGLPDDRTRTQRYYLFARAVLEAQKAKL